MEDREIANVSVFDMAYLLCRTMAVWPRGFRGCECGKQSLKPCRMVGEAVDILSYIKRCQDGVRQGQDRLQVHRDQ